MEERITISVNGRAIEVFRGMKVKHALITYDQKIYEACVRGELAVYDDLGFPTGLDGALSDGAVIFTKPAGR